MCLSSVECLDLSSSSPKWVTLEQRLSCGRSGCDAVAVGNVIHIIGGYDGESALSSVEVFNTITERFYQDQPSMRSVRWGSGAALVGNKIWVVGGWNQDETTLNTIEYLNVNLDTGMPAGQWTMSTTNMTEERNYPAVAAVGHCLVIIGGDDDDDNDLSSAEVLDTERDVGWMLPDMSVPRFSCAAVTLGGTTVVALGGWGNEDATDSVESITLIEFKGGLLFHLSESKCIESLAIDNIKQYVKWAHCHECSDRLLNACLDFIQDHKRILFLDNDFLALNLEEPVLWKCIIDLVLQ